MASTRKDFTMEDVLAQLYADSEFECDGTDSEDSMACYGAPFRSKLYEVKHSHSKTDVICSRSTNESRSARINIETHKNKMKSSGIHLKCTK